MVVFLIFLLLLVPSWADWDIEKAPGTYQEVPLELTEGTWMSLDLSPDGKTLVFGLLGDLYTLPLEGGEAKALTTGLAWDMHPRFSPDGSQIAYTSDRGGGDNIWLIDKNGQNPRQVTEENFRLLSQPAWTPDGRFLAARKHFTSARSLGAGEIWLYPLIGGPGLQMTTRPNDQKDVGEPAFSPDGRYLYYSQDTTPGQVFEYNKDPNEQIYVIQRLDREKGETVVYLSGPGGSVNPTPSPDGKWLAFVRRVRGKTVLFVHEIESGREWALYDGLERDMQETWAIHGVYPKMAWTPDSKEIVFWAQGHLYRVGLTGQAPTRIPFQVKTTRKVAEAIRFPVEVAPQQFPVKAIRWPQVSPDGQRVVFSALGYLWVQSLPGGAPTRLTNQTDHFEFYPSFSRDGREIVYTTWNDKTQGSVRVADLQGQSRVLVEKGQYIEPVFSPDGSTILYRKLGRSDLLSHYYAREPGIYRVSSRGGSPKRVVGDGISPHFGISSQRFYYLKGGETVSLHSAELNGSDSREHYQGGELVTEIRVAPDGGHVAFQQDFHLYLLPHVETGRATDLSAGMKSLPAEKLDVHSADFVHWSRGGSQIHWALGPELFSRSVNGGRVEQRSLSFQKSYDRPSGKIAVVGAKVITMNGRQVHDPGTVVVEGNRIVAVGPSEQVTVPPDAYRVEARGKVVMPGLVDVHWHGSQGSNQLIPQQNWLNYASLAFGVTTLHDPSNDTAEIFTAAEMARAGVITAPRIYSTGTIVYGAKAPGYYAPIDDLEDALGHLTRLKSWGAISVKSYNQPRREQRQQVLEAARRLKLMVVPEGGSLFQHNLTMVVDGHTGVEHSVPVPKVYQDVLSLWGATKVGYTPTLGVAYGGIWGENYWYDKTNVWENERLLSFVPRHIVDPRSRRRVKAPDEEYNHIRAATVAGDLDKVGVLVNLGAHGQREGLAAHWEIWMFVQGGMSEFEALRAATLNGARYVGLDQDVGSLEEGKLADLIVLDEDPLANIRNTESVRYVMLNGRLYEAATMNEIGPQTRPRQPFWWED